MRELPMFKTIFTLLLAILTNVAAVAKESEFNEVVSVGDKASDFSDLPGIDDKKHGLDEYRLAKAVVVVFTSNQCPVALDYEPRLIALQKEFSKQGVQLMAINSNFESGSELEAMKEHAKSQKFNFPYLRDESQEVAKAYGATHTPHVFLLDGDRKIAYMGAIDDSDVPEKVTKHYLRDGIESVLNSKEIKTADTQPFGCRIRIKRRR
jgi:peroxiredoxin